MTDGQRVAKLDAAVRSLKRTTRGYRQAPDGVHWKAAMARLAELRTDLDPLVPALGPIVAGGRSILLHDCTHLTTGVDRPPGTGRWPAFDAGFRVGLAVIAPEALVVTDATSGSQGGDAFYCRGDSGIEYWVAHITTVPKQNTRFRKGQKMTEISADHPRPHVHLGVNAWRLLGHHLVSHLNYTHGAPLIGVQLARA